MPFFVDSNILVYARDASEQHKQARAQDWLVTLWDRRAGRISIQVLQEFYVTVTGKLRPGMTPEDARRDVLDLLRWDPVVADGSLLETAWDVQDRYSLSFWDALIVAAARRTECEHLLTEDLQDGQDLAGVRVVNPFTHGPAEFV